MRPALGFALKPQLRVILAKPCPFEDAEQLMCGNGETPREGILEKPSALSSEMALEARVAIVSHAFCLLCFLATSVASSSNCWSAPSVGMQDTQASISQGPLMPPTGRKRPERGLFLYSLPVPTSHPAKICRPDSVDRPPGSRPKQASKEGVISRASQVHLKVLKTMVH